MFRWEMRTRMFLPDSRIPVAGRTHRTRHSRGGRKESRKMLDVYADFAQNYMAVPVIKGVKTPSERFAGAIDTFTIEAMMQDGKALQSGTSHFLGQNFCQGVRCDFHEQGE